MATIHVQHEKYVLALSGSVLSTSTCTSGSFDARGYKTLRGFIVTSGSLAAGSGLQINQSADNGATFYTQATCTVSACAASGFEYPIYGNAADILISPGTSNLNVFSAVFELLPI